MGVPTMDYGSFRHSFCTPSGGLFLLVKVLVQSSGEGDTGREPVFPVVPMVLLVTLVGTRDYIETGETAGFPVQGD